MPRPVYSAKRQVWRDGGVNTGTRQIPEETALALTYNGGTYAVMMGSRPQTIGYAITDSPVGSRRGCSGTQASRIGLTRAAIPKNPRTRCWTTSLCTG